MRARPIPPLLLCLQQRYSHAVPTLVSRSIWWTILQGHGCKLAGVQVEMTLKIIAHEDRTAARDSQPIADDLAVGIAFHHDRTLENPLPIVPERCVERRSSMRGEFLCAGCVRMEQLVRWQPGPIGILCSEQRVFAIHIRR